MRALYNIKVYSYFQTCRFTHSGTVFCMKFEIGNVSNDMHFGVSKRQKTILWRYPSRIFTKIKKMVSHLGRCFTLILFHVVNNCLGST